MRAAAEADRVAADFLRRRVKRRPITRPAWRRLARRLPVAARP
jgi:hypothetical protein